MTLLPAHSLVTDGGEVISPTNDLIDYTRTHDGTVIFTGDQHPEQTPHFDAWPVHCVEDTWGAAFHEDLDVQPTDIIIRKGTGQTDGYRALMVKRWMARPSKMFCVPT